MFARVPCIWRAFAQCVNSPPAAIRRDAHLFGDVRYTNRKLQFNDETLAAIQEARAIASGQIEAKIYTSLAELNAELDAEYEAESSE